MTPADALRALVAAALHKALRHEWDIEYDGCTETASRMLADATIERLLGAEDEREKAALDSLQQCGEISLRAMAERDASLGREEALAVALEAMVRGTSELRVENGKVVSVRGLQLAIIAAGEALAAHDEATS